MKLTSELRTLILTGKRYNGLVLLNKPVNVTSHTALSALKRAVKPEKVGHTGTLDKFAEGLLLVLVGKCTKFAPYFTGCDKEYEAVMEFGKETTTLDPEGEIISTAKAPDLITIENVLSGFQGEIKQKPPVFSAVHIDGKRAYKRALQGEKIEMPERTIVINNFQIIEYDKPYLKVSISCSKGTYIRSLARDLGIAAGSRAYLTELKRISVGDYGIKDSVIADNFNPENDITDPFEFINQMPDTGIIHLEKNDIALLKNGVRINVLDEIDQKFQKAALFDENNYLLAFCHRNDSRMVYSFINNC